MLKTDESPAPSVSLPWPLSALSVSIGDNEHRIMDQILRILAILPTRVARCHRSVGPQSEAAGAARPRSPAASAAGGQCAASRGLQARASAPEVEVTVSASSAARRRWRRGGARGAGPPAHQHAHVLRAAPLPLSDAQRITRRDRRSTLRSHNAIST